MIDLGKAFGVYKITCLATGDCYVGSTTGSFKRRWKNHKYKFAKGKGNFNLRTAWKQHGESAFEFCVVEVVQDKSMVLKREQHWIDTLNPEYNIAPIAGNTLGYRHSDEAKQRMSQRQKGRILSKDHRLAISKALLGFKRPKFSKEHRDKIRAARLKQGCPQPPGYKHNDETRTKLRASHLGKKQSESHRAARSVAVTKWWKERKDRRALCSI